jgi:ElaB protein
MEPSSKLESEIRQLEVESKNISKRAREQYLEQVSDFKEKIKQIGDDAGIKAKQVIDQAGEYISQNPQKSALIGLGIGLGAGILLGLLSRRSKHE